MTEKNEPAVPSPWRVDALAVTLFVAGALLAVAVGSARATGAGPNAFGSWGEDAAAWLLEPLGWAALVLLAGWFAVTALLITNRDPVRLAARACGWCVATTTFAVGVDWFGSGLVSPAVAGRGGSVGAYLRFGLEDATEPTVALVVFALSAFAGLILVADWLVIRVARVVWVILRAVWVGAVWANDRVADAMDAVLVRLGAVAKAVGRAALRLAKTALAAVPARKVTAPAAPSAHTAPILKINSGSVSTATPPPAKSPLPIASEVDDAKPENIPIHVHTGPKIAPLLRAVPPPDEQLSNVDYELPPLSLLNDPEPFPVEDHEAKLREVAVLLEKAFLDYGVSVKVVGIHTSPVSSVISYCVMTGPV